MLIDPYGYIAVLCSTNEIYVYSPIGTYMNVALVDLVSFVLDPLDMSFDLYGNLAITGSNGVYIINTPQSKHKLPSNTTLDNLCINKGIG